MIKLDAYDKKILEALLKNAREPVSSIGKKVRLSRENVDYRIKRMAKQGLIKGFNSIFNERILGLEHYVIFLQLINIDKEKEEKLLSQLKNSKYITWVGIAAGKWSLIFDIVLHESLDLDDVIKKTFSKFENNIGDYVLLKLQEGDYFDCKLLGLENPKKGTGKSKEARLDNKDRKILELLNKNSRTSYVEIADKVGLTANGVNARIKNLEKKKVIEGYAASIDWKKMGYEWYGLQFNMAKFSKEIEEKIASYFKKHKKIIFYYKYLGGAWDYDIGILVENSNELRDFINEFRREFSNSVKINDVFLVLDETASYELPAGVFG